MQGCGTMTSKTFCPLPWKHLATHPHGRLSLCCEADTTMKTAMASDDGFNRTLQNTQYNYDTIMNSESFRNVRLQMLKGEYPQECKRCWESETAGNRSKRIIELERHNFTEEQAIQCTDITDGRIQDISFEFIELRLGNHCNLICRTCNPISSTRWRKEWHKLGLDAGYNAIPQTEMDWPLDQDFWDSLLTHVDELRFLYINGGEPLLIDKHGKFLKELINLDVAKNVTIVYSTNSTVSGEDYEDIWKEFYKVETMLSIDDLEGRNEYMRYPSKWDNTVEQYHWFKELGERYENINTTICQTVSILNIYYLSEFYEYFNGTQISCNFVTNPMYYDPAILPQDIKDTIINKYKGEVFYDTIKNYLSIDNRNRTLLQFFDVTNRQDVLRKESYKETFPEFYDLIKDYDR